MTYTIFNTFRPYNFGTDAIERQRVALGQSIIDADFEYGLQGTKWQIYQDIRKSPSMFEIPGTDFTISSVNSDAQTPSLITSQMFNNTNQPQQLTPASNVIANQILLVASASVVTALGLVTITTAAHNINIGQVFPLTVVGVTPAGTNQGTINGTYTATVASATSFTYYVPPNTVTGTYTASSGYVYIPLQQTVNNSRIDIATTGIASVTPAFPHNFVTGNVFQAYIGNVSNVTVGNLTSGVYTCTALNATQFTFQTTAQKGTTVYSYLGFEAGTTQYLNAFAFQVAAGPNQAAATTATGINIPTTGSIINGLSSYIAGTVTSGITSYPNFSLTSASYTSTTASLTTTVTGGTPTGGPVAVGMIVSLSSFGATGGFAYVSSVTSQTNFVVTFTQPQTFGSVSGTATISIPAVYGVQMNYTSQSWNQNFIPGGIGVTFSGNTYMYSNIFSIAQYPTWNPTSGLMTVSTSIPHGITTGTTVSATIASTQPLNTGAGTSTNFGSLNGTYLVTAASSNTFTFPSSNIASAYSIGTIAISQNQIVPLQNQTITPSGGYATLLTAQPHNLPSGTSVQALVSGISAQAGTTSTLNGTYTATTFTPNVLPPTSSGITLTGSGTTATVTFTTPHGLTTGCLVAVYGTSAGNYATTTASGAVPINVTSPYVFTYTAPTTVSATVTSGVTIQSVNYLSPQQTFNVTQMAPAPVALTGVAASPLNTPTTTLTVTGTAAFGSGPIVVGMSVPFSALIGVASTTIAYVSAVSVATGSVNFTVTLSASSTVTAVASSLTLYYASTVLTSVTAGSAVGSVLTATITSGTYATGSGPVYVGQIVPMSNFVGASPATTTATVTSVTSATGTPNFVVTFSAPVTYTSVSTTFTAYPAAPVTITGATNPTGSGTTAATFSANGTVLAGTQITVGMVVPTSLFTGGTMIGAYGVVTAASGATGTATFTVTFAGNSSWSALASSQFHLYQGSTAITGVTTASAGSVTTASITTGTLTLGGVSVGQVVPISNFTGVSGATAYVSAVTTEQFVNPSFTVTFSSPVTYSAINTSAFLLYPPMNTTVQAISNVASTSSSTYNFTTGTVNNVPIMVGMQMPLSAFTISSGAPTYAFVSAVSQNLSISGTPQVSFTVTFSTSTAFTAVASSFTLAFPTPLVSARFATPHGYTAGQCVLAQPTGSAPPASTLSTTAGSAYILGVPDVNTIMYANQSSTQTGFNAGTNLFNFFGAPYSLNMVSWGGNAPTPTTVSVTFPSPGHSIPPSSTGTATLTGVTNPTGSGTTTATFLANGTVTVGPLVVGMVFPMSAFTFTSSGLGYAVVSAVTSGAIGSIASFTVAFSQTQTWTGIASTINIAPTTYGPYNLTAFQHGTGAAGFNSNAAAVTVTSPTTLTYQTGQNSTGLSGMSGATIASVTNSGSSITSLVINTGTITAGTIVPGMVIPIGVFPSAAPTTTAWVSAVSAGAQGFPPNITVSFSTTTTTGSIASTVPLYPGGETLITGVTTVSGSGVTATIASGTVTGSPVTVGQLVPLSNFTGAAGGGYGYVSAVTTATGTPNFTVTFSQTQSWTGIATGVFALYPPNSVGAYITGVNVTGSTNSTVTITGSVVNGSVAVGMSLPISLFSSSASGIAYVTAVTIASGPSVSFTVTFSAGSITYNTLTNASFFLYNGTSICGTTGSSAGGALSTVTITGNAQNTIGPVYVGMTVPISNFVGPSSSVYAYVSAVSSAWSATPSFTVTFSQSVTWSAISTSFALFPPNGAVAPIVPATLGYFNIGYVPNGMYVSTASTGNFITLNSQAQFLTALPYQMITPNGSPFMGVGSLIYGLSPYLPGTPYVASQYQTVSNAYLTNLTSNVGYLTYPVQLFSNTLINTTPISAVPATQTYLAKLPIASIASGGLTTANVYVQPPTSFVTGSTFPVTIVGTTGGIGGNTISNILPMSGFNPTYSGINGVYTATWVSSNVFSIPVSLPVTAPYTGGTAYIGFQQTVTNAYASPGGVTLNGVTNYACSTNNSNCAVINFTAISANGQIVTGMPFPMTAFTFVSGYGFGTVNVISVNSSTSITVGFSQNQQWTAIAPTISGIGNIGTLYVQTNAPHYIPIGQTFVVSTPGLIVNSTATTSGGITNSGTAATVAFASPHNLTNNTFVTITGSSIAGYNGTWPIFNVSGTTFQFYTTTTGTITGTATVTPQVTSNVVTSTGYNSYAMTAYTNQAPVTNTGLSVVGSTFLRSTFGFTMDNPLVVATSNIAGVYSNIHLAGGAFTSNIGGIVTVSNFSYTQPSTISAIATVSNGATPATVVVAVTTSQPHGLSQGQYVMLSGIPNTSVLLSTLNGGPYQIMSVTGPTTFNLYPTSTLPSGQTAAAGTVTLASGQFNYFNQNFTGGVIPGGYPASTYQGLLSNVINITGLFNQARNYDRAEGFTVLQGIATNGTYAWIAKGQVSTGANADRVVDTRSAINTNYTVCRRGGVFNNYQGKIQNIVSLVQSQPTSTSNLVTVTTSVPHGIIPGTPILVTGWTSNVYGVNGAFFTENVYSVTTFTYTPWYGVGGVTGVQGFGGSIYTQPYAYIIHRPFDGGCLLSVNVPAYGASVVRQSKKVFRYQSGKGLLFSTGTLFCPNNDITVASSSGLTAGSTLSLVTDIQHGGPQSGATVSLKGFVSPGYNGSYSISNVVNTTTVTLQTPTPTPAGGISLSSGSSIAGDGTTTTVTTGTAHGLVPGSYVSVNGAATFTATASSQTSVTLSAGTVIAFGLSVFGTAATAGTTLTNTFSTLGITGGTTATIIGVTVSAMLVCITGSGFTFAPVASGVTLTGAGITGTYTTNGTYIVYPSFATGTTLQVGIQAGGTVAASQTMTSAQLNAIGVYAGTGSSLTSGTISSIVNNYAQVSITGSGQYYVLATSNLWGTTLTTSGGTGLLNGTFVGPSAVATTTSITSTSGVYPYIAGPPVQYALVTPTTVSNLGLSSVFGNVLATNTTTPTSSINISVPTVNLSMSYLASYPTSGITVGMPFNTASANYVQVLSTPTTTSFTYASPANTNGVGTPLNNPGGIVISPGRYTVSALSANAIAATLTTSIAHNFTVGTRVTLSGFQPTGYNATYFVQTVPSPTTFTVATTVNATATTLGTAVWDGTLQGTLVQSTISSISADGLGTSTVTTTSAHNMVSGTVVNVNTGTGGTATFNTGSFPQVIVVTSSTTFTYPNSSTTSAGPGAVGTGSSVTTYYAQLGSQPRFVINNWQGSSVRAGCFDDQNGIFWEYDGQTLWAVKRTSTQQLSGLCAVAALGQMVVGDANTRFLDQLKVNDKVTMRGMTYSITGIQSQNQMTISPPYRGANSTLFNIKLCRIAETRTPQSQFNRDPVNGTGASGYTNDLTKMQMIGIQYTWYGAGFIDFMIRGSDGNWVYAHRYTNNNVNDEAYMRTGNQPVRYEIINETSTAQSTLAQSMGVSDYYFVVNDNPAGYWPSAGTVQIENEFISYNGYTTTAPYTFNVVSRAAALNYSIADTGRAFRAGPPAAHTMVWTTSGLLGPSVYLVSCTCFPALSHWGSAFIMDGQFDSDRGYFFNYTYNIQNPIVCGVVPQPLFFLRLSPAASGGLTGDTGGRDLLNRAQLLLSKLDCSAINTVNPGGTLNIQGILNPAGFDSAAFNWQPVNTVSQGGQPSFCQFCPFNQVANGQYIQGSGERIFSLIAIAGAISTIDLTSLKELSASIPGTNRMFPDGPDTLMIIASAYNQNVNSTTLNLYWGEAQA